MVCSLIVLVLLAAGVNGALNVLRDPNIGIALQLTDLHLDLRYIVSSDVPNTLCHARNGTAGMFGSRFFCDSPASLVERTIAYVANTVTPDFILLTGDFARHDDYAPIPRTWQEILDENTHCANLIAKYFPGVPVIPSIGNNDVYPHDVMNPPGPNNVVLAGLAKAWKPILDGATSQAMLQGGWMVRRVSNNNIVISLNTLYLAFGPDCNLTSADNTSIVQMEWLYAILQDASTKGLGVIISGHIPVHMWKPSCRALYASMCVNYADTIRGQIFAHLHSDQFHFVDVDGNVDPMNISANSTIVCTCSPSIVPNFNPSFRVWKFHPNSFHILDYDQYYANIDDLNNGPFAFKKEYSLLEAYEMDGIPSNVEFWARLNRKIANNLKFDLLYQTYKFVSMIHGKDIDVRGKLAEMRNTTGMKALCTRRPWLCK